MSWQLYVGTVTGEINLFDIRLPKRVLVKFGDSCQDVPDKEVDPTFQSIVRYKTMKHQSSNLIMSVQCRNKRFRRDRFLLREDWGVLARGDDRGIVNIWNCETGKELKGWRRTSSLESSSSDVESSSGNRSSSGSRPVPSSVFLCTDELQCGGVDVHRHGLLYSEGTELRVMGIGNVQ